MKIINFQAQNVMNLKAIEIAADGKTVILSGQNEIGKSSVIDGITMALTGQMVERPIKDGEKRAEVVINLGDYIVKRVWTAAGNRLEVTSKDGAKYPSPQTLLDKIIGKLSFDPLAFKDMEKKAQRDLLVKLVGLDFAGMDQERKTIYDNRTLQNKILAGAEARLAAVKAPEAGLPAEEVSIVGEMAKVNDLETARDAYLGAVKSKEDLTTKIKQAENDNNNFLTAAGSRVKELQDEIDRIKKDVESKVGATEAFIKTCIKDLDAIAVPAEITKEQIDGARAAVGLVEGTNVKVRAAKTYHQLKAEIEEARKKSEELTKKIDDLDADKAKRIQAAQYPIPGLSVSDDSVIYNDIPFSQASDGVKIRVSTAIAMKINPSLKVILIKEASLLDSNALKSIIDTAKENDYQLWIERVSDAGQIEIHIED